MAEEQSGSFAGPTPKGERGEIVAGAPLPIEGAVELEMPLEELWETFLDVGRWPRWNPCIWRSRVRGGEYVCRASLAGAEALAAGRR